jgi:hypothetical protein
VSEKDYDTNCSFGLVNRTRLETVEKQVSTIFGDLKEIKEKLLGRPTWIVCFLLSAMLSIIVALLVFVLTHLSKVSQIRG